MPVNKKGEDKMENAKVSNKKLMSLAILFVSALEMGGMGLQPALADIAAAFPNIPTVWMQEMSNWPGFAMLLGCALSTLLATKVSKKVLCQIGVGFVVAYAVLGFTLHSSFIQLMMWQTILGLGFGFLMPTSNGIIAENYAEDERGKLMGIQDLFTNGGGMYLTLIGGVLAAKAWNYTYLAFLYALIPLVLGCIYFPADKPAKASGEKSHLKIAPITWLFGAIIFVFINSYGVMGANISFIITERGMGTAALTGTAMAIFLVGGMFGGLIFNPFEKKLREYVLCCGFIALVIGFLIIYFAQSVPLLALKCPALCSMRPITTRLKLPRQAALSSTWQASSARFAPRCSIPRSPDSSNPTTHPSVSSLRRVSAPLWHFSLLWRSPSRRRKELHKSGVHRIFSKA